VSFLPPKLFVTFWPARQALPRMAGGLQKVKVLVVWYKKIQQPKLKNLLNNKKML